jgi:hypothetical protein
MRFPVDADLAVFLYVTGRILFTALPNLRKSVPHVPILYQINNVPEASLSESQAHYFAPYDEKLAAMNYSSLHLSHQQLWQKPHALLREPCRERTL